MTNVFFRCFTTSILLVATVNVSAYDFGVDMPQEPAPGVEFPTSETTINEWVFGSNPDYDKIYQHGWGIWGGLTKVTGITAFGIEKARIYQTWLSPKAILDLMNGDTSAPVLGLRTPRQHLRGGIGPDLLTETPTSDSGMKIDYSVAEMVAYSPTSAKHAYSNKLLWTDTLNAYVEKGYTEIPPFPNTAVNIKPVYKLISRSELNNGKLYGMPAWPGTPDTSNWTAAQKAAGFPNTLWNQCVYIDVDNKHDTQASGVDTTCNSPSADNTYGLGDFIHIKITSDDQAYFRSLTGGKVGKQKIEVGDILILVGMHTTSRETERWTWQTFWWAANPSVPRAPSSTAIASQKPKTLDSAASHYAMAAAYSMLSPAQPLVGGHNIGSLLPAYNPHLEAGFGTGTFGETAAVQTPGGSVTTDLGVQSNCMSCHGMAGYATKNSTYVSNFYVPRDASNFAGGMTIDFAWSVADEAQPKPKYKTTK